LEEARGLFYYLKRWLYQFAHDITFASNHQDFSALVVDTCQDEVNISKEKYAFYVNDPLN